jgi:hypothetical protein
MCGAQCLRTSREKKQLGRTSGGRIHGRLKLIEIDSKWFSNRLCCADSSWCGRQRQIPRGLW